MELYIIRHGQSANNVSMLRDLSDRVDHDPELTDLGIRQAKAVADYIARQTNIDVWVEQQPDTREAMKGFGITKLYCSPMRRALQTCLPISEALDLQPEVWVDIHEHGGLYMQDEQGKVQGFPGLTRAEMQATYPRYTLTPKITERGWWNPETGYEERELSMGRALQVASTLKMQGGSAQRIALVTHGTFASHLLKAILNMLPNDDFGFTHYNTGITRVDFRSDGKTILRYVNRVEHLTPELMS